MYDGVKETPCERCAHCVVCMFKNEFQSAQKAVDDIMVNLDQNRSTYLRDIRWVKPVELECVNFLRKPENEKASKEPIRVERDQDSRQSEFCFMETPNYNDICP